MAKHNQSSIITPTEEELIIYNKLIPDISEVQMDDLANTYFEEVSENNLNISFPRYIIDKMIRPIKPGDTISLAVEDKNIMIYCLMRKTIEGKDYLLFAESDEAGEFLRDDMTYLFYVDGQDEVGMEIIDILPAGTEADKILDILEVELNVQEAEETILEEHKQE